MHRVIILGIDGLSLSVLEKASSILKLNNIEEVLNKSIIKRSINSVIPPSSAPAWVSMFTGLEPHQHKVYDFFDLKALREGIIRLNPYLSSKELWQKTIWNRLSRQGKRVLVVGVPVFYPAREVNGVYICGELLIPKFDRSAVYPRRYYIDVVSMGMKVMFKEMHDMLTRVLLISSLGSQSDKEALVHEFTNHEMTKFKVFKEFFEKSEYDLSIFVSTAYDYLAHYMLDEFKIKKTINLLREYLEFIDEVFNYMISYTSDGKYVFIITSDHGIHTIRKVFLVNTWLKNIGLLKPNKTISYKYILIKNLGMHVARLILRLPIRIIRNEIYTRIEKKVRDAMKLRGVIEDINIYSSKAYALSYSSFGIFVKENEINDYLELMLKKFLNEKFKIITSNDPQAPDIFLIPYEGYTVSTKLLNLRNAIVNRKLLGTKIADHTMDSTFILYNNGSLSLEIPEVKSIIDIANLVYRILRCS